MSKFKIVHQQSALDFTEIKRCKTDTFYNAKGKKVSSSYQARQYKIIGEREHRFSCLERSGRGLLSVLAIIFSLGAATFSKEIHKLLFKKKETTRYAILDLSPSKIKALVVGNFCAQSYPCKHFCQIIFQDDSNIKISMNAVEIKKYILETPKKVRSKWTHSHFLSQNYIHDTVTYRG